MKLDSQQTFDEIWPDESLPSDGPYAHGDSVFVWIDDKAKYKAVGCWARARVISQNGAIVTADSAADYVQDFKVFMTKIKAGTFSALNVSFEDSNQILELSAPSCSMTPLFIDHGLEASNPFDINAVSNVNKLTDRLRSMTDYRVLQSSLF